MKEKFVRFGEYRLAGVLHLPSERTLACVITCHGLYSSKDSEKYTNIGISERSKKISKNSRLLLSSLLFRITSMRLSLAYFPTRLH